VNEDPATRSVHFLTAGCAGGMALAAAGTWLRFVFERTPRIDTHTWPFALASAVSGAGLIATGVCAFRLAPRAGRLSWRALGWWTAVVHGLALPALALTSSDVLTNLCFGALSLAGLSPYTHAPSSLFDSPLVPLVPPRWVNDPSPYGPLFHPFARAAAWVGARASSPFWVPFFSLKALMIASLLAGLAVAARHLRRTRPADATETFAALAFGPLLTWEISAQGHNDALLVLAIVAFLAAASAARETAAVAALAAGVAVKYALAPLLGLYLLLVARRSVGRAGALAVTAALVLAAAFWPEARSVTLRSVLPMIGGEATRHAHSFADLVCLVLDALALPGASLLAYRFLSAVSVLLCASLLVHTAWRARTLESLAHGYLLFLFGLYLTAPWFQPWYLSWGLPLLIVEPDARWRRFTVLFSILTVVQWAVPFDPVTTVMGNVWAAWRILCLSRPTVGGLAAPGLASGPPALS